MNKINEITDINATINCEEVWVSFGYGLYESRFSKRVIELLLFMSNNNIRKISIRENLVHFYPLKAFDVHVFLKGGKKLHYLISSVDDLFKKSLKKDIKERI